MRKLFPTHQTFTKPTFSGGMWRIDINGKHYCAETLERLEWGLKEIGLEIYKQPPHEADVRHPSEKMRDILYNERVGLSIKQDALVHIQRMAKDGNELADKIISSIPSYRSPDAIYYTKQAKKSDFLFMTHEDLTELVDNIVLRSKLILELGNLYSFRTRKNRV